ncbi:hypothetical protein GINT2_001704 [Glugoides intestinalis]
MDFITSQQKSDQSQIDKKKASDGYSVILEQQKAVSEAMKGIIRPFRLETVFIDTLSGQPLMTKMWVSTEIYTKREKRAKEHYKCEHCGKIFDKRQKMLLHSRFHGK